MLEAITPQVQTHDVEDEAEHEVAETESERREREQQEQMDAEEIERNTPQFVLGEEIHPHDHAGQVGDAENGGPRDGKAI